MAATKSTTANKRAISVTRRFLWPLARSMTAFSDSGKIGGWRTRSVFERYAIVDQSDIAAAVKRLEASEQKAGNSYSSATVDEESTVVATVQTVN